MGGDEATSVHVSLHPFEQHFRVPEQSTSNKQPIIRNFVGGHAILPLPRTTGHIPGLACTIR